MLRQVLLVGLVAGTPVSAQAPPLVAYGTVTDPFGTPVPGARIAVVSFDISPGVRPDDRPSRAGQCPGVRPVAGAALSGPDGRFRLLLPLQAMPRALTCLEIVATPPAGLPLTPIYLSMDSVPAAAVATADDSVRMDIIVPSSEAVAPAPPPPLPPPPSFRAPDEELLWLAQVIPGGFGGYWRAQGAADIQVYLTDLTAAPQAKRLLLEYFRLRPPAGGAPGDVLFMHGRWDAATLVQWRDRLRAAGAAAGVRGAELRLDWNRVQVAVRAGGRPRLLGRLPALGIPVAALFVVGGG
jgi:hypothetical protein